MPLHCSDWSGTVGLHRHHSVTPEMVGLEVTKTVEENSEATEARSHQKMAVHWTALRHRSGLLAKHLAQVERRWAPRLKASYRGCDQDMISNYNDRGDNRTYLVDFLSLNLGL